MNGFERIANTATNYFWGLKAPRELKPEQKQQVKLVAHRGVHETGALENSLESFELAVQNKIWGIEFDVRFTADNIPVVHHDPHCQRLYNCDVIIEKTETSQLKKLVPQIPTLEKVVRDFGRRAHLLIEIKEAITPEHDKALAQILAPLKPIQDYHLLTLNPHHLDGVTFAQKNTIMDVDWMNMAETISKANALGHGAVSGHFMLLNDARLSQCKAKGLITGTGFIETKGALYREINRGIDWIFTNHPLRLKAYLA